MLDGEVRKHWVRDVDSGCRHHLFVLPSSGHRLGFPFARFLLRRRTLITHAEEVIPSEAFHVLTHGSLKIRFEGVWEVDVKLL